MRIVVLSLLLAGCSIDVPFLHFKIGQQECEKPIDEAALFAGELYCGKGKVYVWDGEKFHCKPIK